MGEGVQGGMTGPATGLNISRPGARRPRWPVVAKASLPRRS